MQRTLYVIGSSHASRLVSKFRNDPFFSKHFLIKDYSRPGATFEKLNFPDPDLVKPGDSIVFMGMGNDLFPEKGRKYGGKYHLLKFVPQDMKVLEEKFTRLAEKLGQYKGPPQVIGLVPRFLHCCRDPRHHHKGLITYQRKAETLLKHLIQNIPGFYQPLSKILFPQTRHKKRFNWTKGDTETFLLDNVHLKSIGYETVVEFLKKKYYR